MKAAIIIISTAAILLSVTLLTGFTKQPNLPQNITINSTPSIRPDYADTTIPPNIAPLNFNILTKAEKYCVIISAEKQPEIKIHSTSPQITIPQKPWKKLLDQNTSKKLNIKIFTADTQNNWQQYQPITINIAPETIDPFIVYRKILPSHFRFRRNGPIKIVQQNLTNYKTKNLLNTKSYKSGCVNCHSPLNCRSDKMTLGIRSSIYGTSTLLIENDTIKKIKAKFGYSSWHPSGKVIAYSTNKLPRFFHSAKNEVRDTVDLNSFISYYNLETNKIKTVPHLAEKQKLETFPAFSPDGKFLYCSLAKKPWKNTEKLPPENFDKIKYDLVRIPYDINTDTWGKPQTVLSAEKTQKSILMSRISPDGNFLIACFTDYGAFPAWLPSSDLYSIDLNPDSDGNFQYKKLSLNTPQSQSWHSFSSNSRWLAYSSKQQNGLFTRIYIAYINPDGSTRKPFVIPQKNPDFYDSHLETFSFPELSQIPAKISNHKIAAAIKSQNHINVTLPITMASPKKDKYPKTLTPYTESE